MSPSFAARNPGVDLTKAGMRVTAAQPVAKPLVNVHPLTDEKTYRFVLPYPPSANAYWRSIVIKGSVRVLVSKDAKQYKERAGMIARRLFPTPLKGPIGIQLRVYRPEKRGDLSNRIKVLEDALSGIAYDDDSQIVEIRAYRHDSPRDGKVEVSIWQL